MYYHRLLLQQIKSRGSEPLYSFPRTSQSASWNWAHTGVLNTALHTKHKKAQNQTSERSAGLAAGHGRPAGGAAARTQHLAGRAVHAHAAGSQRTSPQCVCFVVSFFKK